MSDADERLRAFRLMARASQEEAIRRLIATGTSEYGAAAATGLSVEMIRRVLAEHRQDVQDSSRL